MHHPSPAVLHLLCGKIASGKSTLAHQLAQAPSTVLVCEDQWLAQLYPGAIAILADYQLHAQRLCAAMEPLVIALLRAGTSVVMDFPANTVAQRAWLRGLADNAQAEHALHVLAIDDEVCLARLRERNQRGDHPFATDEAAFRLISSYFVEPHADEQLHEVRY